MADTNPLAGPTPTDQGLPVTSNASPLAQPSPQSAPVAPPDSDDPNHPTRLAALGHAVRHFANALEGKQTVYAPDPKTGDITANVVPRKPGGFFRDILLGAVAGGAAGASAPKGSGPLGGFFTGAQAESNQAKAQDSQRKVRAQESADKQKSSYDQQQSQQKENDIQQASIAQHFINSLQYGKSAHLHDDKQMMSHNNSAEIVKNAALKNGGAPAQVDGNGEKGNGPALMKQYNQDPTSVMQAPDGFHRIPFIEYDTAGLVHKDGTWVDPKSGKEPDWNDHATVTLVDLPNSAWNKNLSLTKGDVNNVAGSPLASGNSTDNVSTTFGSLFGLGMKNLDGINKERQELYKSPKNDDEANQMAGEIGRINADPKASDDDKKKAGVWQTTIDKRQAAKNKQLQQETQSKTDGKENPFPVLKEGEVGGYIENAKRVLQDSKSTPEQKAQAQEQVKYGAAATKTIQNTAVSLAAAKKAGEIAAENAAIDKSSVGAVGLPDQMQKRFTDLPGQLQTQLSGVRTRYLASLFALADGDTSKSTFPSRVYKGSNQLSQADAFGYAKMINPELDEKLYKAKQNLVDDYTNLTGTHAGAQIAGFNNFLNHAGDAADVTAKWRTANSPLINRPMNWLRNNAAGDPEYTKLIAALAPVRKEYQNFLNSNRAEHKEDIVVMDKILADSATPAQIEEGLKQLANTATLRLDSINQNWKTVTKGNYPNLVTPKAVQAAAKLGAGQQVSQYGSGGSLSASSTRQTPAAQPPAGASAEVYAADGKTLLGHAVNGKFVALSK